MGRLAKSQFSESIFVSIYLRRSPTSPSVYIIITANSHTGLDIVKNKMSLLYILHHGIHLLVIVLWTFVGPDVTGPPKRSYVDVGERKEGHHH